MKVFHVEHRNRYVRYASIPVEAKALAVIYCFTLDHLRRNNPWLTDEQVEIVAAHLAPKICYKLYKLLAKELVLKEG